MNSATDCDLIAAVATELIKTLQQITSNLVIKEGAGSPPEAARSASINAASSAGRAGTGVPSKTEPVPGPTPAAAQGLSAGRLVSPPRQEEVTAATIIADFGIAARREAALQQAHARLQQGGDDFWAELFVALQTLLFNPECELRPETSEPYVEGMLTLPEQYIEQLRKRLTPVLVLSLIPVLCAVSLGPRCNALVIRRLNAVPAAYVLPFSRPLVVAKSYQLQI